LLLQVKVQSAAIEKQSWCNAFGEPEARLQCGMWIERDSDGV